MEDAESALRPTICLIGPTGVGKSTTANTLLACRGNDLFTTSDGTCSATQKTSSAEGELRGGKQPVRVVDTPGLLDSAGKDQENVRNLADVLTTEVRQVDVFLVLLNSQEPRLNSAVTAALQLFQGLFGEVFLRNVMIGFTRWGYDRVSCLQRRKSSGVKDEKVIREARASSVNTAMQEALGHDFELPCVFLDNAVNMSDEEELEIQYGPQEEAVVQELNEQVQAIAAFMEGVQPFGCQVVDALRAERQQEVRMLLEHYLALGQHRDEGMARNLVLASQDILTSGWLWWRRRWIYGVLRRQSLRFYEHDGKHSAPAGPRDGIIDLLGCICTPTGRLPFSLAGAYFNVYSPLPETMCGDRSERAADIHRFGVEKHELQQWIAMIMDAAQVSEGCSRVRTLHETLSSSKSPQEYLAAVRPIEQQIIEVPVGWMKRYELSEEVQNLSRHCVDEHEYLSEKGRAQLAADLQREAIKLDHEWLHGPEVKQLFEKVALSILDSVPGPAADEASLRACALVLARDVLGTCSRTLGGGYAFAAVEALFRNRTGVVDCMHDTRPRCAGCLKELKAPEIEKSACEACGKKRGPTISIQILRDRDKWDALRRLDDATGVCELQEDSSRTFLGRRTTLAGASAGVPVHIEGVEIHKSEWIPDEDWDQCMICGLAFSLLFRRHHCRMCGKMVCWSCSRQKLRLRASSASNASLASQADLESEAKEQRVCFVCYTASFVRVLNERKKAQKDGLKGHDETSSSDKLEREGRRLSGGYAQNHEVGEEDSRGDDSDVDPAHVSERVPVSGANTPEMGPSQSQLSMSPGSDFPARCPSGESLENSATELPGEKEMPCISVTMDTRFKVVREDDLETVLYLDCSYMRVIRWSGCADEGRVLITVRKPP
eukprot:TRINITY_DN17677_c1_g1_i1.p1 TRINITY_DN17677_c1_g1~~TRINITY_DN17677_c1_g1_i1.p1  ORF type:complete len:889 (+),score=175.34 TRINITY_DN17677_c1_g1_i1:28-2694(+)